MTNCKQCGAAVTWTKKGRRWYCFNAGTETDHWDSCSKRRWQQTVSTGQRFENIEHWKEPGSKVSGYADSIHGTKFDRIQPKVIKGKHSKRSGKCEQCVPPWEICQNACPDSINI